MKRHLQYNQEYTQYAHYYGIEDEAVSSTSADLEFVNINGQLIPVLADVR